MGALLLQRTRAEPVLSPVAEDQTVSYSSPVCLKHNVVNIFCLIVPSTVINIHISFLSK